MFDGVTFGLVGEFFAYDASFHGGVFVAAGDIDGDGRADIITGAGGSGGPHVKVFNGTTGALLHEFFAFDANFRGGVHVTSGDVNGDGRDDVVVAAGAGGGPHVKVYDGVSGKMFNEFFAFNAGFRGGVFVSVGDINGDGRVDIITGAGEGGGPHVKVFSGVDSSVLRSFFAFDASFRGGARVGVADFNRDGIADLLVSAGPGNQTPNFLAFDGNQTQLNNDRDFAFDSSFHGGVFVGGF